MPTCIYCGLDKPSAEFSDEHIWPDALGGDYLPHDVWRTDDVCRQCNSMSGVYIDGSFIRSWIGQAELSTGSDEYLAGSGGKPLAVPLDYIGKLQDIPVPVDHVADYWTGSCGTFVVHIRPEDVSEQWGTYAGGDPKAKKASAGRAYMAIGSAAPFWVLVSLASFRRRFKRSERIVVNVGDLPTQWPFKSLDRTDPVQIEDLKTVDAVIEAARSDRWIKASSTHATAPGDRMLAKLALALGHKLLGAAFLQTDYAKLLRQGMREANAAKRAAIPISGYGILSKKGHGLPEGVLKWPGGWVLLVTLISKSLQLTVVSPSGKSMGVVITDDQELLAALDPKYAQGAVWITVPVAEEAVGPILLSDYLAHKAASLPLGLLASLLSKRGDPATLPPCRDSEDAKQIHPDS